VFFVDANEFTLVCFWIKLQEFLVRQIYFLVERFYELCSMAYSNLNVSTEYVLPVLIVLCCL